MPCLEKDGLDETAEKRGKPSVSLLEIARTEILCILQLQVSLPSLVINLKEMHPWANRCHGGGLKLVR